MNLETRKLGNGCIEVLCGTYSLRARVCCYEDGRISLFRVFELSNEEKYEGNYPTLNAAISVVEDWTK